MTKWPNVDEGHLGIVQVVIHRCWLDGSYTQVGGFWILFNWTLSVAADNLSCRNCLGDVKVLEEAGIPYCGSCSCLRSAKCSSPSHNDVGSFSRAII